MKITPVFLLIAVVAVLKPVLVHAQADTPKAERPVWPPPGSTWAVKTTMSGSLGSGVREMTIKSLGEVDWEGRRVLAIEWGDFHVYSDSEGRLLGTTRNGKTAQTLRPYEALYDWPLFVGKSWSSAFQVTYHARNETIDEKWTLPSKRSRRSQYPPAGSRRSASPAPARTFVTYPGSSPMLGLEVKTDWQRHATHPLGVGTYQMEAISYAIKN